MKCNNDNPKKYKKSLFEKIANFIDMITGGVPEDNMTDEENEQLLEGFEGLRSYSDGEGRRKWYFKR